MSPISEKERKIILEFCHLLEKSKQLFNGLRELTPYGNKQWQAHFGRTFDIYAKLWKFQQQYRPILDLRYGLKRWQIGEIASKIGQLYYHFYLRTSEIAYLVEAFSFYLAIRGRQYYNLASKEAKSELMVKKLRYYARFIVVAILLRQSEIINELLMELEKQIVAYGQAYDPNDQAEWLNVLEEVRAFLNADPGVTILDPDNNNRIVTLSGRLSRHTIPSIERTLQMNLKLQDAIIIGSGTQLVKFSELTIDMFRMLQNLEWEIDVPIKDPSVDSPHASGETSKTPKRIGVPCVGGNVNPHKYLLFKPSACQVVTYVASTINELPQKGVLLIFISADGYHPHQNTHPENYTYDIGGLITSSKSDIYRDYNRETKSVNSKYKNKHILYPGDLQPFTRKPLVIIVDSDNSYAFQHISRTFGLPLLVLMSPLSLPGTINDRSTQGSLFTLFLHNSIAGLCNSCEVFTINLETWEKCSHLRDVFMKEAIRLLMRTRVDPTYHAFLGCEFLRLMILRYIFCECTLRLHRGFRARTNLPRASPPLPDDLIENGDLMSIILDIADCIGVREYFYDPSAPGTAPRD
ncbi:protein SCAI [Vanessa tameamea]|uniref:Protein SCAI n=1 Tax=Vanessa tameamea TaxID=334116 RepID=A0A8B8INA4_VANTA|nr:protein SCAI [Vanessa tameamea]XP_047543936.1 protein SCAI [Vanessa atalanta]